MLIKIAKQEKISPKEANTKYRWNDLDHSGRLIIYLSIINNLNDSESDAPSTNPGEMEKKDDPETLEVQGETGWRGGQGRGRVGTGLRDAIGADSGVWYDTGLDRGKIENMAKQRARQNGHPRQWNSYLLRSMREP